MTGPRELPGLPAVTSRRSLSGGSIAAVELCRLADGRDVVVKHTSYDASLEAEGLAALAEAGGPVPAVLAVEPDLLVVEHVTGPADWAGLGAQVAEVHRLAVGDTFGWARDNVVGPLPQDNRPSTDWPSFYVDRRLRPYLGDLPAAVARRLEAACDGPVGDILAHGERPSLVHGDLWSGNVVAGRWLIDPAVHRADREFDLAFAALFGGIPAAFWDGYTDRWPLDAGWQVRRPVLQLYHLLVHVRLFGGSYVGGVTDRLAQLGC